jgi:hypothetical protein
MHNAQSSYMLFFKVSLPTCVTLRVGNERRGCRELHPSYEQYAASMGQRVHLWRCVTLLFLAVMPAAHWALV